MRGLERNKVGFFYATYQGETDTVNAAGAKTGGKTKSYSSPVFMRANISPANGTAREEPFGKDLNYSHVIYVNGTSCPITEESKLWIYKGLDIWSNVSEMQSNYVVVGISQSMNETLYAIRQKGIDRRADLM